MADSPGIVYPQKGESQDTVNRNIYDNLFFLRGVLRDSTDSHTMPIVKLTASGTNGYITFNAQGIITDFRDPT